MKRSIFIIAEAGVNHNGSMELAYQLIDKAAEAGADAVKFQTFIAEKVISNVAKKAEYQISMTGSEETQLEMVKRLELSFKDFEKLKKYCDQKGILFLSTAFDDESLDFLADLGVPLFKIPSGEITNLPFLKKTGKLQRPILLSTGMCSLGEVEQALKVLRESGTEDITLLHCNTAYPTPMEDVNLQAMVTLKEAFKLKTGYSDHTLGITIPIAASALGAAVIEKHFTLSREMEGPDHNASLEPLELQAMVLAIRNVEKAMGDGIKTPSVSELKNSIAARKSIVALRDIAAGETLSEKNLGIKRPGDGISPVYWEYILGRKAIKDFKEDELIEI